MNLRFECFKLAYEISNKTEMFCATTMRSKLPEEIEKAWQQIFSVAEEINEFCNKKPKTHETDFPHCSDSVKSYHDAFRDAFRECYRPLVDAKVYGPRTSEEKKEEEQTIMDEDLESKDKS